MRIFLPMPLCSSALYTGPIGYDTWGNITPADIKILPAQVGVYLFYGENTLPLYVGKSVNIRSRVLSHFRDKSEVQMMRQVKRIQFETTAGEIGALLRESHLIKHYLPLFNIRLRRTRKLYAYMLKEQRLMLVQSSDFYDNHIQTLYGMFSSQIAAKNRLRELSTEHHLCLGFVGLEKVVGQGCFNLQLKKCLGACVGREAMTQHTQRLLNALEVMRIQAWPYKGTVGIVEKNADLHQVHWINNGCYLGSTTSNTMPSLAVKPTFEFDTYKILSKAMAHYQFIIVK